jgi:hypothetical protein
MVLKHMAQHVVGVEQAQPGFRVAHVRRMSVHPFGSVKQQCGDVMVLGDVDACGPARVGRQIGQQIALLAACMVEQLLAEQEVSGLGDIERAIDQRHEDSPQSIEKRRMLML